MHIHAHTHIHTLTTRRMNANIQVQNYKNHGIVSYVSSKHTNHKKHAMFDLFNICSNHVSLNYSE